MSARAPAIPGSVQRKPQQETENINISTQDIANLAYALWQQRGSPNGSPDQDWFEAEKIIQTGQRN